MWGRNWAALHRYSAFMKLLLITAAIALCTVANAQSGQVAILEPSLPPLQSGLDIRIPLHAAGGAPPYRWAVTAGDLPEGILFTNDGVLLGRPTKAGAFAITVTVYDSSHPALTASRDFRSQVTAALLLEWLRPPAVHGNQIDGAVQVSNSSDSTFDLTVFIVAVNEIGRATSLRYQHLDLRPGTANVPISFSETLPPGSYVVHADAIAEIPARNSILRQRLQTPGAIPVTQGP